MGDAAVRRPSLYMVRPGLRFAGHDTLRPLQPLLPQRLRRLVRRHETARRAMVLRGLQGRNNHVGSCRRDLGLATHRPPLDGLVARGRRRGRAPKVTGGGISGVRRRTAGPTPGDG